MKKKENKELLAKLEEECRSCGARLCFFCGRNKMKRNLKKELKEGGKNGLR